MDATHPSAASGAAAAAKPKDPAPAAKTEDPPEKKETWTDQVKTVAGLAAVITGVIAVAVVAIVAMLRDKEGANVATIATSAVGVVATIVGAYFGVKLGNDKTTEANKGQKEEAAKAQVYAAHLPATEAEKVLAKAAEAAQQAGKA